MQYDLAMVKLMQIILPSIQSTQTKTNTKCLIADFSESALEETGEDILNIENPDDVIPVDDLDDEDNKVIVFDDIKIDRKNMDRIN